MDIAAFLIIRYFTYSLIGLLLKNIQFNPS